MPGSPPPSLLVTNSATKSRETRGGMKTYDFKPVVKICLRSPLVPRGLVAITFDSLNCQTFFCQFIMPGLLEVPCFLYKTTCSCIAMQHRPYKRPDGSHLSHSNFVKFRKSEDNKFAKGGNPGELGGNEDRF